MTQPNTGINRRSGVEAQLDELGDNPGQVGSDSAGQSGDTQGLSNVGEADEESVDELVETGQDFEADVITGIEDAGNHPERPVRTHEQKRHTEDENPAKFGLA